MNEIVPLKAGSYKKHPAKAVHFDGAKDEEVIVQITGIGPEQRRPSSRSSRSGRPITKRIAAVSGRSLWRHRKANEPGEWSACDSKRPSLQAREALPCRYSGTPAVSLLLSAKRTSLVLRTLRLVCHAQMQG